MEADFAGVCSGMYCWFGGSCDPDQSSGCRTGTGNGALSVGGNPGGGFMGESMDFMVFVPVGNVTD